jgi:hypothetical protein
MIKIIRRKIKMETQTDLDLKIGTKEFAKLHPVPVIVIGIVIRESTNKHAKYVVLICQHPESAESLDISQVIYLKDRVVKESGLWLNKDLDGNIQKGSPLAVLMDKYEVSSLKQLEGKKIPTELNTKGFICLKAY